MVFNERRRGETRVRVVGRNKITFSHIGGTHREGKPAGLSCGRHSTGKVVAVLSTTTLVRRPAKVSS